MSNDKINHPSRPQPENMIKLQCSHNTTNTVTQSHQTNTNRNSTNYFFTLKTVHPARSAINCDVYVGGKVRVSEFMIFLTLQHWKSK